MNFNFYEQYKNYPTVELLKIVQQPAGYQSEAIEAANRLLSERNISDIEFAEAKAYHEGVIAAEHRREDTKRLYKDKALDILEPVIKPSPELNPEKWLGIFLLAVTIQYLYYSVKCLILIVGFIRIGWSLFDLNLFIKVLEVVYTPILLLLLYRRRKLGWILLFINSVLIVLFGLAEAPLFFRYQEIHHGNTAVFLFPIFLNVAFANFLFRQNIADLFNVLKLTKRKTLMYTLVLGVLFILAVQIVSSYATTGHPFSFLSLW